MIKTNLFRMYNGLTFERITKIDSTNSNNLFGNDDEFQFFDNNNKNIICGSYEVYTYNGYSLTVFEGDIVKIVTRDTIRGEYGEHTYEGQVVYEDNKYKVKVSNIGYMDLEDKNFIVDIEIIGNYFTRQNKLYKIKTLVENYFVSGFHKFEVRLEVDGSCIYILNNNIIFKYIIIEKRLQNETLCGRIDYENNVQNMLISSCIDYLRKEITKIWEEK